MAAPTTRPITNVSATTTPEQARRYVPPWRRPALDRPIPLAWSEDERRCRHCGGPTHWHTRLQPKLGTHPGCEGDLWERLTPEAELDVLYSVVAAFPGSRVRAGPAEPEPARLVELGPCSWCGRPGVGIDADSYRHCAAHLWPPYRWPPPGSRS